MGFNDNHVCRGERMKRAAATIASYTIAGAVMCLMLPADRVVLGLFLTLTIATLFACIEALQ